MMVIKMVIIVPRTSIDLDPGLQQDFTVVADFPPGPDSPCHVSFDHAPTPTPTAQLSLLNIINSYSTNSAEN